MRKKPEFTYYRAGERSGKNVRPVIRGRINGRTHEFATDARSKKEAAEVWREYRGRVERELDRSEPRTVETFGQIAAAYLVSINASKNEERYVERLCAATLPDGACTLGTMPIGDVRPMDIHAATHALYGACKASTRNRQGIAPGAAILHYAAQNEIVPYRVVRRLDEDEAETRRPDKGVPSLLLSKTDGDQYDFLLFLFAQGWRVTEACNLESKRCLLVTKEIEVYVSKARKWKPIPMHGDVHTMLSQRDARDDGYVFPWRSRSGVYKWLTPLCRKLGVKFTPHMARHEFASRLNEQSATKRDTVDVGTWTNERSVSRYQTAHDTHKQDVINRVKIG